MDIQYICIDLEQTHYGRHPFNEEGLRVAKSCKPAPLEITTARHGDLFCCTRYNFSHQLAMQQTIFDLTTNNKERASSKSIFSNNDRICRMNFLEGKFVTSHLSILLLL